MGQQENLMFKYVTKPVEVQAVKYEFIGVQETKIREYPSWYINILLTAIPNFVTHSMEFTYSDKRYVAQEGDMLVVLPCGEMRVYTEADFNAEFQPIHEAAVKPLISVPWDGY